MKKILKKGEEKTRQMTVSFGLSVCKPFWFNEFFLTVWWERSFFPTWAKMAMSGVELEAECKTVYDEVQSKKKHRYVTFMIADGKIKVDKVIKRISQLVTSKIVFIRTLFEKSNICPKIQFWQNPNIFTSFSPKFLFDNFSREIKVVNS